METLKTFDYGIFKSITSNREVDPAHVRRLVKAIRNKNLLHLNPIICNEAYEVIDGQHRLEAVKEIGGIYLYYIIDPKINKEDIALINSNAKNWTIEDYINYWTIEKKPGFDILSKFLSKNPLIHTTTAMILLSSNGNRDTAGLKNGSIDVSNYSNACKIAEILKFFRNFIDFAYERSFVRAVVDMFYVPGFDFEILKAKLEFQQTRVVKCINKKMYLKLLEEIYNYKSRSAIRFD